MPGTIGGGRPAGVVVVICFENDSSGRLSQTDASSAIGKGAAPGAEGGDVIFLKKRGVGSDDEELSSFKSDPFREIKVGVAPEFPAGEIDADGAGIIEFNELAICDGFARRVVVHLGKNDTGTA